MPISRSLTEDSELFRKTVGPVKPLRDDRLVHAPRRRAGRARFTKAGRVAAIKESLGADRPSGARAASRCPTAGRACPRTCFASSAGANTAWTTSSTCTGLNVAQAKHAMHDFLAEALARQARCVRIIHGKGLGSGSRGAVIKSAVDAVLRQTSAVAAYVSAARAEGGTGAVLVLLSTRF